MSNLRDACLCLCLALCGFMLGWEACAARIAQAQQDAEREWRVGFEQRKREQLVKIDQAIAEADSESERKFFQSLKQAVEKDFKDDY